LTLLSTMFTNKKKTAVELQNKIFAPKFYS